MAKKKEKDVFSASKPLEPVALDVLRGLTEEWAEQDLAISQAKKAEQAARDLRKKLTDEILRILTDYGLKGQKWADGLSITRVLKKYPSVPSAHAEEFKQWLKDTGDWELLAKIPSQTVQALLKERIAKRDTLNAMILSTTDPKFKQELEAQLAQEASVPPYIQIYEDPSLKVSGKMAALQKGE